VLRFGCDFVNRELENTWHTFDRLPRLEFFADEKREDEIVRSESCLTNKIAGAFAASQSSRPMDQFSHGFTLTRRNVLLHARLFGDVEKAHHLQANLTRFRPAA
jgi:hypothetical protein